MGVATVALILGELRLGLLRNSNGTDTFLCFSLPLHSLSPSPASLSSLSVRSR